jgi:TonB family protein
MLVSTRVQSGASTVTPIVVSLIERPLGPPVPPARVTLNPALATIHIRLPQATDFPIQMPAEPTPSAIPSTPVAGLSGTGGTVNQAGGGPLTLTVTHYVAPRYPDRSARFGEHGEVAIDVLVNAQGNVDQVKIVRSTASRLLDRAAVSAVRQWKFAPVRGPVPGEPVWGKTKLVFAPPQRILGVPFIVVPYDAIARKIDGEIATNREGPLHAPTAEPSVRSSLEKLIAVFSVGRGHDSATNAGESIEAEVGLLGPIHSVRFVGFVDHGFAVDRSDSSEAQGPPQPESTHWEAYDIEQNRGSSVWLVEATARGSIQRIEFAVR